MATVLPAYGSVIDALSPVLEGLPGKLIGLDGRNGVGKTTLGRYIAWHFNISLLEADLFRVAEHGDATHDCAAVNRAIQRRLDKPRPVVIESILLRSLLRALDRTADFVVYCNSPRYTAWDSLVPLLEEYEARYRPRETSTMCVTLEWNDS